ncbi:hypothetical protein [Gryllotalpicola protaetiae]|uniref:Head-tail adaptor protein n=1 Tax=Gryllotalpicola protaetiae TaxID=2419771 RepID=A0A387BVE6_9MICO|nr:hypothetical protein [Gryllotalpicola protaetiae]AYG02371.1 hypothetical protein D7I44_01700 [Gryllotalpicola protaetiae]
MAVIGETVRVQVTTPSGVRDEFNREVYLTEEFAVPDVLIGPTDSQNVADGDREGVESRFTLHFPRGVNVPAHARVQVRGEWLDVLGTPASYILANTPGRWSTPVRVGVVHG